MPFIDLDTIKFYEPPTQGLPSFDKPNCLSDARVLFGNEGALNLKECNGRARVLKDAKVNEIRDRIGSERDGDLMSHQTWTGDRDDESRSQGMPG